MLNFLTKYDQKKVYKTKKGEHSYSVPHIGISLSIKFHLKLTIFTFWIKFAQKGYFQSKAD